MDGTLKTSGVKSLNFLLGGFCLFLVNYATFQKTAQNSFSEEFVVVHKAGTKRPVMHTFFEPVKGGCCSMTEEGHTNLVHAWRRAWEGHGWETRVLNEADALTHPFFDPFQKLLIESRVNEYDRRCFWRWLAMANQPDGGWMADYDNFPLTLTADIGLEMEKEPGFKTWQQHVPSLLQADKESWNRIIGQMMNFISPDLDVKIISDMQLLLYLHTHLSEQQMGVAVWDDRVHNGFPYVKGDDNGTGPKINCSVATSYLTAHLSHKDSHMAMEELHIYPKIEGMAADEHAERRADAANVMMKDFRDQCVTTTLLYS